MGLALITSLALASACAIVEPPLGGPIDKTPPHVVSFKPDSAAVGLAGCQVLRFRFSEKMDRANAISWLSLFPEQEFKKTKWHGATEAEVFLTEPLPADTLIVVELLPGMTDSHRIKDEKSRRYPLATGDSIFSGRVTGQLLMADMALDGAVVELFAVPPDTLEYFQQTLLRRATSDSTGTFRFEWLPVPGGPWLMRAFADTDNNLRLGEKEAQRLLADTLSINSEFSTAAAGTTTLYPWNEPGTLTTESFDLPEWVGGIGAWAMSVSDADTGWVPAPAVQGRQTFGWLDPAEGGRIPNVVPHLNRVVVFVDMDGDSTFSAVPDSVYGLPAAADMDTTAWFLEPWGLVEEINLEPGLEAGFIVPALGDSLVSWIAPPPALPDTLGVAEADSTGLFPEAEGPETESGMEQVLDEGLESE
ncbi:MAG: hypothetical protein KOO60_03020 [Gemmatimonadales bacterium]|nr:hypothetical protein [Gemmatimonadales bacterium]